MRSFFLIGSALLLLNCSTEDSICSKEANCLGWNSARQDACEEELEGDDEIASEYDCESQFSTYMNCVDDTASCQADQKSNSSQHKFESSCGAQKDDLETRSQLAERAYAAVAKSVAHYCEQVRLCRKN